METGERIKEARLISGLTQKELGDRCGINEANIRKYESGRQNPKYETLQKISSAIQLPVSFLQGEQPFENLSLLHRARGLILFKLKEAEIFSFDEPVYTMKSLEYYQLIARYVVSVCENSETNDIDIKFKINNSQLQQTTFKLAKKDISTSERELLRLIRNLSAHGQEEAIKRIKEMLAIPEYRKE